MGDPWWGEGTAQESQPFLHSTTPPHQRNAVGVERGWVGGLGTARSHPHCRTQSNYLSFSLSHSLTSSLSHAFTPSRSQCLFLAHSLTLSLAHCMLVCHSHQSRGSWDGGPLVGARHRSREPALPPLHHSSPPAECRGWNQRVSSGGVWGLRVSSSLTIGLASYPLL